MKKYLILFVLFACSLLLSGCKNTKISQEIYDNCKKAVNITDDYIDKYTSKDEANSKLQKLECNYDSENEDELYVCILFTGLQVDFISPSSTTSDIKEARNKLAKECGL